MVTTTAPVQSLRTAGVRITLWELLAAIAIGTLLMIGAQYRLEAFSAEYSVDGASHFISGAMIHDYMKTWPWTSPLKYLVNYHSQYPLVGIGLWPPAFYVVEAGWMAIAGSSKVSMLLLCALVASTCAATVYWLVARTAGRLLAACMAVALLLAPVVQHEISELMLDVPLMLACLLATLIYARYMASPTLFWGVVFGLAASAAILTKGNAFSLALVPVFAVLLGRRLDLLKRASFWAPALVVAVLAGLWTAATYGKTSEGFRYTWGLAYTSLALKANALILWNAIGPFALLALIGLGGVVRRHPLAQGPVFTCAAALLLAVYVFQCLVPVAIQERYMLPALPAALILAPLGVQLIAKALCDAMGKVDFTAVGRMIGVVALCLAAGLSMLTAAEHRVHLGLASTVQAFWSVRQPANPVILAALGGDAEAPAIAEIAAADPARPSAYVIRGSRLLGGGSYNNQGYAPKFETAAQVMEAIDSYNIPYVLLRRSDRKVYDWTHLAQIEEAVVQFPDRWQVVHRDTANGVVLYRVLGNENKSMDVQQLRNLSGPKAFMP